MKEVWEIRYDILYAIVFVLDYDEVDNFFSDLLDHLLFLMNQQQEQISFRVQRSERSLLKVTGRQPSDDANAEHVSSKRLKMVDHSRESARDYQCSTGEHGRNMVCGHSEQVAARRKPEFLMTEERKNQFNQVSKNHSCRIAQCDEDLF